jgi:hypothetical protein
MNARVAEFDVIVACDTFVRNGRWEEMIAAAATALRPNGLLLVTLEKLPRRRHKGRSYRLLQTGRFCRRASYVLGTLAMNRFIEATADAFAPRLECGGCVIGLLLTVRAPIVRPNGDAIDRECLHHDEICCAPKQESTSRESANGELRWILGYSEKLSGHCQPLSMEGLRKDLLDAS